MSVFLRRASCFHMRKIILLESQYHRYVLNLKITCIANAVMKKIILAFDGVHFSEGAFEFAKRINDEERVLLTGVFLPQANYANLWSFARARTEPLFVPLVEADEAEVIQKHIKRFETLCQKNTIEYRVHKDFFDFALPALKKESRFADLMILGSQSFFENMGVDEPNVYLKDMLHATECPVIVVPEHFELPESNILCYDGSASSVFAIKQYAYLFPGSSRCETLLVTANNGDQEELPEEENIQELVARHFPNLSINNLHVRRGDQFRSWIQEHSRFMLVSGSFGRSSFSQVFKKSFVSGIIGVHKSPVFLAHR